MSRVFFWLHKIPDNYHILFWIQGRIMTFWWWYMYSRTYYDIFYQTGVTERDFDHWKGTVEISVFFFSPPFSFYIIVTSEYSTRTKFLKSVLCDFFISFVSSNGCKETVHIRTKAQNVFLSVILCFLLHLTERKSCNFVF